jgi:hypothetical protein
MSQYILIMNISCIFHYFIPSGEMSMTFFSLKFKKHFFIHYVCSYEYLRRNLETAVYLVY